MKTTKSPKRYYINTKIIKVIDIATLVVYALISAFSIYGFITFITTAPEQQSYIFSNIMSIVSGLMPLVLFAIAYALNPRKLTIWTRSFESLLIAIAACVFMTVISIGISFIPFYRFDQNSYLWGQIVTYAVSALVLTITLWRLRRKGHWAD